MPRSNRSRARRRHEPEPDLSRVLLGTRHTESKRDGQWNVQPVAAGSKSYACPGCGLEVTTGSAHVVTWRADGIMGEADDLAARRHWHTHCWRIKP